MEPEGVRLHTFYLDMDRILGARQCEDHQVLSPGEEFHQFGHQDPSIEVSKWGRRAPATIDSCSMTTSIRPAYGLSSLKQNQFPRLPCQTLIPSEKFRDSSSQGSDVASGSFD